MAEPYITDFHEFTVLSNGNYLVLGLENVTVDMSRLVTGGRKNAVVNK